MRVGVVVGMGMAVGRCCHLVFLAVYVGGVYVGGVYVGGVAARRATACLESLSPLHRASALLLSLSLTVPLSQRTRGRAVYISIYIYMYLDMCMHTKIYEKCIYVYIVCTLSVSVVKLLLHAWCRQGDNNK